ncbi:MAG: hypothetical protein Q9177_001382 [Variospora cf. flavescens]
MERSAYPPGAKKRAKTHGLISTAVGQSDHARIRRLYAHAFTDTALLEQAPLLAGYFELLISKLKQRINGPEQGRVDLTTYYNFTTFDIIGYLAFPNLRLANRSEILGRDLTLGEPFGALTNDEYHPWIKSLSHLLCIRRLSTD